LIGETDHAGAPSRRLRSFPSPNSWKRLTHFFQKTPVARAGSIAPSALQGAILDALDDWICTLDEGGRVILANAALARDHGCTPDALTGTSFVSLIPPEARDAVGTALQRAGATGEPQTCQH
jgi:PAS domain-containing protein